MAKSSNWCEICGGYKFAAEHKCPPAWKTHIPDYDVEDDWTDVYARTPEYAAQKRAEDHDAGEYDLLDGGEIIIHVQDNEGKILKFNCTGEAVPEYRAKLL